MPDGMTPEKPLVSPSSFDKMRNIGLEEAQKFQQEQPMAQKEMPDIRMLLDPDEAKNLNEARLKQEMMLEGMFGERGRVREFADNARSLKGLQRLIEKAKDDEKKGIEAELEKTRERLAETYVSISHTGISEINTLNNYLENLRNPFPYDSRWAIQYFEQGLEQVNNSLRNESEYDEEGLALLRMLRNDFLWAASAAKVSEAMGPSYELYFDGELELSRLRNPHTELLARDFIRTFKRNPEEMEEILSVTERLKLEQLRQKDTELVRKTLSKIEIKDAERYQNLKEKGLREVAIDYQDAYGRWLYSLIAVNQQNMEKTTNDDEAGEHYMELNVVTRRFLGEVFDAKDPTNLKDEGTLTYIDSNGKRFRVYRRVLNPFCMPRSDEVANLKFMTRMHELVVKDGHYMSALKKIKDGLDPSMDESAREKYLQEHVDALANTVKEMADQRALVWESLDAENPYDRLAFTIIRSLNNLEQGTLASGDLGWRWEYEKVKPYEVKEGKIKIRKKDFTEAELGAELWDLYTKRILLRENVLGKEGKIYYIDDSGQKKEVQKLTEDQRVDLADQIIDTENVESEIKRIQTKDGVQFYVRRKSELGSIYDNHDITTVMYLAKHIIDYDVMADTRSTIFPPTIGWYRKLWESQPPYWRPDIRILGQYDHELQEMIFGKKGITGDANVLEKRVGRPQYNIGVKGVPNQLYGKYDWRAASYVNENAWAFVTPFLDKPGDPESHFVVLPIFTPTQIKDMSFWRMTTLEKPSAKVRDYPRDSIWHQRLRGESLSNLKWENMDKYKYSWTMVTNDQMERWLGPLITPHEFSRLTADEVKKHYAMPSGKSEKESGKRARLGGRAGLVPEGVLRATVFAQNKIIASIGLAGLMGVPSTEPALTAFLDKWAGEWVAPWINVLLDMPSVVRGCTNYGGTSAQSVVVTYIQVRKMIKSVAKHSFQQVPTIVNSLIGRVGTTPLENLYK